MREDSRSVLIDYAEGRISKEKAIEILKIHDYATLLVMLGDAGLSKAFPSDQQIEA